MKTKFTPALFCLVFSVVLGLNSFSQSTFPQGFNYQAIARNSSGTAIINTDMKAKIGILSDTTSNTLVWEEEHSVRTNGYGLFSLVVGGPKGTRTGGSALTFDAIDWAASQMFIYVQIKNPATATSYTPMGKAKLWSVPYALLAGKSQKDLSSSFLSNGDTVYLTKNFAIGSDKPMKAQLAVVSEDDASDDPLFEVRRKDGQPVFSVYNDAVTINVPMDGKKGSPSRGGFAVGGFDVTKGTFVSDLFRVTPDSVRIYINNTPVTKGSPSRGGFAVGGFDETKARPTELFRVTHDSTRVYTNETSDKGFAVGYLGTTVKTNNYMRLNKSNYFIGHEAGKSITNGQYNLFLGYGAGRSTTGGTQVYGEWQGCNNIFIGYNSGYGNTTGYKNVFIGYQSGKSNSSGVKNTFIGNESGTTNSSGGYNTFLGYNSGIANSAGQGNTFVGADCGFYNTSANNNTCMGTYAGENLSTGSYNTFIGGQSGHGGGIPGTNPSAFITGNYNTAIGYQSGFSNVAGSGNIFIGYQAGYSFTGSNSLYIDNSSTSTPLIYGNFSANQLSLNGNVGVNRAPYANVSLTVSPNSQSYGLYIDAGATYAAYINGNVIVTGTVSSSDIRWKKNIAGIKDPLARLLQLNGVSYEWNTEAYPEKGFEKGQQIGLIAQDVEQVFPEFVRADLDGYKGIIYDKFTAVLVEAIKEQQKIIDNLKLKDKQSETRITELTDQQSQSKAQIEELTRRINKLEETINVLTGNK